MGRPTRWVALATLSLMLIGWTVNGVETADSVERVVAQLLSPATGQAPPIASDREHADTLAPVLVPGTAVLLHSDTLPLSDSLAARYMVSRGRVFTYNDSTYNPLEIPLLRIRPIDGGQKVPFLIRAVLYPRAEVADDGSLQVVFPMPVIFKPTLETRAVWIGGKPSKAHAAYSLETGAFNLKIPITAAAFRDSHGLVGSVSVIIQWVSHATALRIDASAEVRQHR